MHQISLSEEKTASDLKEITQTCETMLKELLNIEDQIRDVIDKDQNHQNECFVVKKELKEKVFEVEKFVNESSYQLWLEKINNYRYKSVFSCIQRYQQHNPLLTVGDNFLSHPYSANKKKLTNITKPE